MTRQAPIRAALAASALAGLVSVAPGQPAEEGWRPFTATWTLSGQRDVLATEGLRPASILHLSGPLTVTSREGPGRGFLGEVIGFDDGGTLLVGRAVFEDERGDKVFCTVKAQPIGSGRRVNAVITGGTGRFAGLEGDFSFVWQYVVEQESDQVSLRTADVEGRTRLRSGTPR
ncbi:MAG TPA: hypothetical protein VJA66_05155 [Thermoanaerobaculia bacterium]